MDPIDNPAHSQTVLDEQDAAGFLKALDHPELFRPHLSWLTELPSVLPR